MHAPSDQVSRVTPHLDHGRGRWQRWLLAGLCATTLVVGLQAIRRETRLGDELLSLHRSWTPALARYGRIGGLALDISSPCNEVFDSGNLAAESERSQHARVKFEAQMDSARIERALVRSGASGAKVREDLVSVKAVVDAMIVDVDRTFASYEVGPPPDVEVIDHHLDHVREALGRLTTDAITAQDLESQRLMEATAGAQRTTLVVLVLLALLVIAVGAIALRDFPRDTAAWGRRLSYALLMGLALFAAAMGITASHSQKALGDRVRELNRTGSERLARYGRMERLVLAMSAPCNEVFDSGNLEAETARSRIARLAFASEMDSARRELAQIRSDVAGARMLEGLATVGSAIDTMLVDVDRTFSSFGVGRPPDVAAIDGHWSRIHDALGRLAGQARDAEALDLAIPLAPAFPRWLAFGILLLIAALAGGLRVGRLPLGSMMRARAPDVARPVETPMPSIVETPMPSIVHAAPDPALLVDPAGRIIEWNARAEKALGLSGAATRSVRLWDLGAPAERETIERAWGDAVIDPETLDRPLEITARVRDGREFPAELAIAPAPGVEAAAFQVFVRDISERRRTEAALRESEARTRAIVEAAVDGIITADDTGAITTVNPASERIFGYRSGELRGKQVRDLIPCPDETSDSDDVRFGVERGPWSVNGGTHELMGLKRDGSSFPIELSVSEARVDGTHVWTGMVRDITLRKQAERLKARQDRLRDLLDSPAPLAASLAELVHMVEEQHAGVVCVILTVAAGEDRPRVGAAPSLPAELARALESIEIAPWACSWSATLREKARVIVEDTALHPAWSRSRRLAREHGLRSCWSEPIVAASGQVLGAVLSFRRRVYTPSAFEIELGSSAAHLASIAIERAGFGAASRVAISRAGSRAGLEVDSPAPVVGTPEWA